VVHSTTKYLGGHSDVVGGAIVCQSEEIYQRLAFLQNAAGAVPGPLDCFLVLRGLKTLPVRMDRHTSNAAAIADFLGDHMAVEAVYYPFHESHPQVDLAKTQMLNGGGMISFVMKNGASAARRVAEQTELFTLAESLGSVESLIEVPALMTHASTTGSPLEIDPGLVRLSVGLEHADDLRVDLESAIAKI
jgi:cystathionine beta-lyase/cystathionine gamma-synthase